MAMRVVFTVLLLSAALPGLVLALSCYRRRAALGAFEFSVFIAACSVYAIGYAGELWAGSLGRMLAMSRFEYIGISFIPTFWILFVLRYTGRVVPKVFSAGLVVLSAATFAIVLTMHRHGLYYVRPRLDLSGPFPTLAFDRGPWYWLFVIYIWLSLLFGEVLLLRFYVKVGSFFKTQTLIAFSGALLPFVANTFYLLGLVPDHIDPTPLTMPAFALPLALSLLRFHFLDIVPFARELVVEALSDGVLVVDARGRVVDANPAARELLGLGSGATGLLLGEACAAGPELAALAGGSSTVEFEAPRPAGLAGGGPLHLEAKARPIGTRGELGTVMLLRDISETRRLMARLDELARTDSLTGIANRRGFLEVARRQFETARRHRRSMALCVMDLDHFKAINDERGHDAGDVVLREVARRLGEGLRASDMACRWGGEEFAVFLPDCDRVAAAAAAERLRLALSSSPVACDAGSVAVSASLGVVCGVPGEDEEVDEWLRRADLAMYEAKRLGRNRVEFA